MIDGSGGRLSPAPGTLSNHHANRKGAIMERETENLIELGSVTDDTAGDWGVVFEMGGRMHGPGLVQD
jgi:hypothetical protein